MIIASATWGFSGYFFKLTSSIPPLEVLSHRVVWSSIIFTLVLLIKRQGQQILNVFTTQKQKLPIFVLGTVMITINWFVFVLAIQISKATEASLGYFIFPLVAVFVGAVFLGDRLSSLQWIAVTLAAVGVIIMGTRIGTFPWISILLAVTFCMYGLVKRSQNLDPIVAVTADALLVSPLALIYLVAIHGFGWQISPTEFTGYFGSNLKYSILLILSGAITAGPLILMSYATVRIPYTEVGLIQYLNPTLQFIVATLIFMEPLTRIQLITYAIIWVALILYTFDFIRVEKSRRNSFTSS